MDHGKARIRFFTSPQFVALYHRHSKEHTQHRCARCACAEKQNRGLAEATFLAERSRKKVAVWRSHAK
jgi:hypothetical protein